MSQSAILCSTTLNPTAVLQHMGVTAGSPSTDGIVAAFAVGPGEVMVLCPDKTAMERAKQLRSKSKYIKAATFCGRLALPHVFTQCWKRADIASNLVALAKDTAATDNVRVVFVDDAVEWVYVTPKDAVDSLAELLESARATLEKEVRAGTATGAEGPTTLYAVHVVPVDVVDGALKGKDGSMPSFWQSVGRGMMEHIANTDTEGASLDIRADGVTVYFQTVLQAQGFADEKALQIDIEDHRGALHTVDVLLRREDIHKPTLDDIEKGITAGRSERSTSQANVLKEKTIALLMGSTHVGKTTTTAVMVGAGVHVTTAGIGEVKVVSSLNPVAAGHVIVRECPTAEASHGTNAERPLWLPLGHRVVPQKEATEQRLDVAQSLAVAGWNRTLSTTSHLFAFELPDGTVLTDPPGLQDLRSLMKDIEFALLRGEAVENAVGVRVVICIAREWLASGGGQLLESAVTEVAANFKSFGQAVTSCAVFVLKVTTVDEQEHMGPQQLTRITEDVRARVCGLLNSGEGLSDDTKALLQHMSEQLKLPNGLVRCVNPLYEWGNNQGRELRSFVGNVPPLLPGDFQKAVPRAGVESLRGCIQTLQKEFSTHLGAWTLTEAALPYRRVCAVAKALEGCGLVCHRRMTCDGWQPQRSIDEMAEAVTRVIQSEEENLMRAVAAMDESTVLTGLKRLRDVNEAFTLSANGNLPLVALEALNKAVAALPWSNVTPIPQTDGFWERAAEDLRRARGVWKAFESRPLISALDALQQLVERAFLENPFDVATLCGAATVKDLEERMQHLADGVAAITSIEDCDSAPAEARLRDEKERVSEGLQGLVAELVKALSADDDADASGRREQLLAAVRGVCGSTTLPTLLGTEAVTGLQAPLKRLLSVELRLDAARLASLPVEEAVRLSEQYVRHVMELRDMCGKGSEAKGVSDTLMSLKAAVGAECASVAVPRVVDEAACENLCRCDVPEVPKVGGALSRALALLLGFDTVCCSLNLKQSTCREWEGLLRQLRALHATESTVSGYFRGLKLSGARHAANRRGLLAGVASELQQFVVVASRNVCKESMDLGGSSSWARRLRDDVTSLLTDVSDAVALLDEKVVTLVAGAMNQLPIVAMDVRNDTLPAVPNGVEWGNAAAKLIAFSTVLLNAAVGSDTSDSAAMQAVRNAQVSLQDRIKAFHQEMVTLFHEAQHSDCGRALQWILGPIRSLESQQVPIGGDDSDSMTLPKWAGVATKLYPAAAHDLVNDLIDPAKAETVPEGEHLAQMQSAIAALSADGWAEEVRNLRQQCKDLRREIGTLHDSLDREVRGICTDPTKAASTTGALRRLLRRFPQDERVPVGESIGRMVRDTVARCKNRLAQRRVDKQAVGSALDSAVMAARLRVALSECWKDGTLASPPTALHQEADPEEALVQHVERLLADLKNQASLRCIAETTRRLSDLVELYDAQGVQLELGKAIAVTYRGEAVPLGEGLVDAAYTEAVAMVKEAVSALPDAALVCDAENIISTLDMRLRELAGTTLFNSAIKTIKDREMDDVKRLALEKAEVDALNAVRSALWAEMYGSSSRSLWQTELSRVWMNMKRSASRSLCEKVVGALSESQQQLPQVAEGDGSGMDAILNLLCVVGYVASALSWEDPSPLKKFSDDVLCMLKAAVAKVIASVSVDSASLHPPPNLLHHMTLATGIAAQLSAATGVLSSKSLSKSITDAVTGAKSSVQQRCIQWQRTVDQAADDERIGAVAALGLWMAAAETLEDAVSGECKKAARSAVGTNDAALLSKLTRTVEGVTASRSDITAHRVYEVLGIDVSKARRVHEEREQVAAENHRIATALAEARAAAIATPLDDVTARRLMNCVVAAEQIDRDARQDTIASLEQAANAAVDEKNETRAVALVSISVKLQSAGIRPASFGIVQRAVDQWCSRYAASKENDELREGRGAFLKLVRDVLPSSTMDEHLEAALSQPLETLQSLQAQVAQDAKSSASFLNVDMGDAESLYKLLQPLLPNHAAVAGWARARDARTVAASDVERACLDAVKKGGLPELVAFCQGCAEGSYGAQLALARLNETASEALCADSVPVSGTIDQLEEVVQLRAKVSTDLPNSTALRGVVDGWVKRLVADVSQHLEAAAGNGPCVSSTVSEGVSPHPHGAGKLVRRILQALPWQTMGGGALSECLNSDVVVQCLSRAVGMLVDTTDSVCTALGEGKRNVPYQAFATVLEAFRCVDGAPDVQTVLMSCAPESWRQSDGATSVQEAARARVSGTLIGLIDQKAAAAGETGLPVDVATSIAAMAWSAAGVGSSVRAHALRILSTACNAAAAAIGHAATLTTGAERWSCINDATERALQLREGLLKEVGGDAAARGCIEAALLLDGPAPQVLTDALREAFDTDVKEEVSLLQSGDCDATHCATLLSKLGEVLLTIACAGEFVDQRLNWMVDAVSSKHGMTGLETLSEALLSDGSSGGLAVRGHCSHLKGLRARRMQMDAGRYKPSDVVRTKVTHEGSRWTEVEQQRMIQLLEQNEAYRTELSSTLLSAARVEMQSGGSGYAAASEKLHSAVDGRVMAVKQSMSPDDVAGLLFVVAFALAWVRQGAELVKGTLRQEQFIQLHSMQMVALLLLFEAERNTPHNALLKALLQTDDVGGGDTETSRKARRDEALQALFQRGHLVEMPTGEGKSLLLAVTVGVLGLLGVWSDVVCFSRSLTNRDANATRPFFEWLGLTQSVSSDGSESGAIVPVVRYLTFEDVMQAHIGPIHEVAVTSLKEVKVKQPKGTKVVPTEEAESRQESKAEATASPEELEDELPTRVLVADEVDVFLMPNFFGEGFACVARLVLPCIRRLLEAIFTDRSDMNRIDALQKEAVASLRSTQAKFLAALLRVWVREMLEDVKDFGQPIHELTVPPRLHDYVVHRDRGIGYWDVDGSENYGIARRWKTAFALLHEIHRGNVGTELAPCDSPSNGEGGECEREEEGDTSAAERDSPVRQSGGMSAEAIDTVLGARVPLGTFPYASLPRKFYRLVLGVTGTLRPLANGVERPYLEKFLGATTLSFVQSIYPRQNTFDIRGEGAQLFRSEAEQHDAAVELVRKRGSSAAARGMPTLFVFANVVALRRFEARLAEAGVRDVQVLLPGHCAEKVAQAISRATMKNAVTLVTMEFGRGEDFNCATCTEFAVVQMDFAASVSVEVQVRGRTGRQGQGGRYYLFVVEDQVVEALRSEDGTVAPSVEEVRSAWEERSHEQVNEEHVYHVLDALRCAKVQADLTQRAARTEDPRQRDIERRSWALQKALCSSRTTVAGRRTCVKNFVSTLLRLCSVIVFVPAAVSDEQLKAFLTGVASLVSPGAVTLVTVVAVTASPNTTKKGDAAAYRRPHYHGEMESLDAVVNSLPSRSGPSTPGAPGLVLSEADATSLSVFARSAPDSQLQNTGGHHYVFLTTSTPTWEEKKPAIAALWSEQNPRSVTVAVVEAACESPPGSSEDALVRFREYLDGNLATVAQKAKNVLGVKVTQRPANTASEWLQELSAASVASEGIER